MLKVLSLFLCLVIFKLNYDTGYHTRSTPTMFCLSFGSFTDFLKNVQKDVHNFN